MITINTNDIVGFDGGKKLVNTKPGSGTITIFKSEPGGQFGNTPHTVLDASTPQSDLVFYIPTPMGLGWKFVLDGGATAEYTKYQTA